MGLGNPGPAYVGTRHNIGFEVVQCLARRHGARWSAEPLYDRCDVALAGLRVTLVRPRTYMNRSGSAASRILEDAGATPEELLVAVDDVDLPLGRIRLRRSGGPGTHNGLRDLVDVIGAGLPRLRIGVVDGEIGGDLADYVLDGFEGASAALVGKVVELAADAVVAAVGDGVAAAMNRFNGRRLDGEAAPEPGEGRRRSEAE